MHKLLVKHLSLTNLYTPYSTTIWLNILKAKSFRGIEKLKQQYIDCF
jgi:hypothetical protein